FHRGSLAVYGFYLNRGRLALECFVGFEEVLVFLNRMLVYIADILNIVPALVVYRNGNDLEIALSCINHFHNANGAYGNENAWIERVSRKDDDIKRIPVIPERLRSKAVIIRKGRIGIVCAVELYEPGFLIYLVFVMRALRNFNDDIK